MATEPEVRSQEREEGRSMLMSSLLQLTKDLATPLCSILLFLAAGFLLVLTRLRRLGVVLLAVGILLLYGLSISPTANWLLRPLESRYPPMTVQRLPRAGTLVVLGGGAWATTGIPVASRLSEASARRVLAAVRLYSLMDRPQIVVCGGRARSVSGVAEAEVMRELLISLGIPKTLIVVEGESRNTFENAKFLEKLTLRRPLVLITSARHMPRAMRVFATLGMQPLPAPCDFQARANGSASPWFIPTAASLAASTGALYEYLGTWWYMITGRI
jgi:uncharacterized SAM-binding protein YcdF (DUF218 family)